MGDKRRGGPLLGPGGPPELFAWNAETGEALPATATFTRASIAEEFDGTDFTQVSSGVIREDSAAVGGGAQGFLPEPGSTNDTIDSDDFTAGSWSSAGLIIGSPALGPSGLRESTISTDGSASFHRMFASIVTLPSSDVADYFIAKAGATGRFITVSAGNSSTDYVAFDLVAGTITDTGGIALGNIKDRGNGYYKCSAAQTNAAVSNFCIINISNTGTPGNRDPGYGGSGEDIILAHAQYEERALGAGLYTTTPIVTTGVALTRVADVLDTDVVIPSEFGALLDVTLPDIIGAGNILSLLGPDATAEDIIRVDDGGDVIMDDGGTPVVIGTATLGTRVKVSYGRDATGRSGSLDGATAVTGGAPGAGHEGDSFQIGSANSGNQSRCIHHNSVIYSVRPTDEDLESLSS